MAIISRPIIPCGRLITGDCVAQELIRRGQIDVARIIARDDSVNGGKATDFLFGKAGDDRISGRNRVEFGLGAASDDVLALLKVAPGHLKRINEAPSTISAPCAGMFWMSMTQALVAARPSRCPRGRRFAQEFGRSSRAQPVSASI